MYFEKNKSSIGFAFNRTPSVVLFVTYDVKILKVQVSGVAEKLLFRKCVSDYINSSCSPCNFPKEKIKKRPYLYQWPAILYVIAL